MRKIILTSALVLVTLLLGMGDLLAQDANATESAGLFQILKEKFIEGDWRFMSFVLVTLILGLAFCIAVSYTHLTLPTTPYV